MKSALKALMLLALCFIDVTVRASSDSSDSVDSYKGVIQLPTNCLPKKIFPCAISVLDRPRSIQFADLKLVLAPGAIVRALGSKEVFYIDGMVWLSNKSVDFSGKVKTTFGTIQAASSFNLFIRKQGQYIEIYPLSDFVNVRPIRAQESESLALPAGYRSLLGPVRENGVAEYEIPMPANFKGLIELWTPLFIGSSAELTQILANYRESWKQAVQRSAATSLAMVERQIASERAQQEQRRLWRKKQAAEEKELNKLFRQKNYLD